METNTSELTKPKYLYKYHRLNVHLFEMLTNAELYLSSRTDLNDPLDSTVTMSLDNYLNFYYEKYPSLKTEKHTKDISQVFKWKVESGDTDWLNDIDDLQSKIRVSCFTEDGNNPLMWSHYADNHTGVCLKFDLSKDSNLQNALQPVSYTSKLIDAETREDLQNCLLTKLNNWEIEKEWRIISDKEKFRFKHEAVAEIIFGLKVPIKTLNWFKYFAEGVFYGSTPISKLKIKGNRLVKVNEWDDDIIDD